MNLGDFYIENKTKTKWKLVCFGVNDCYLENEDTFYTVSRDELKNKFTYVKNPIREIPKLKQLYNGKNIELNKKYFVSEWSWNPICDGYNVYPETIRYMQEIDGFKVYTTGKNYRHYFSWDIHETEDTAREIANLKNSYGYDWCDMENNLIDKNKIINELDRVSRFEEVDFDSLPVQGIKVKLEDIPRLIAEINRRKLMK